MYAISGSRVAEIITRVISVKALMPVGCTILSIRIGREFDHNTGRMDIESTQRW